MIQTHAAAPATPAAAGGAWASYACCCGCLGSGLVVQGREGVVQQLRLLRCLHTALQGYGHSTHGAKYHTAAGCCFQLVRVQRTVSSHTNFDNELACRPALQLAKAPPWYVQLSSARR